MLIKKGYVNVMVIMIASMGYDEDQIDHDGGKLDDDVDNLKMIVEL